MERKTERKGKEEIISLSQRQGDSTKGKTVQKRRNKTER